MITIPGVDYTFLGVSWDLGSQLERTLNRECLAERVSVQWLVIHCSAGISIGLGSDNHPGEPGHWAVVWDLFHAIGLAEGFM